MVSRPPTETAPENAVATGRRESQRARLRLGATITTTTRDFLVIIRNLSCTGAMVEADEVPNAGRTVTLKRGAIDALAEVVWTRGGQCGLHFDEPLDYDEVVFQAHCPPETVETHTSGYSPAGGKGDRLSAEEWKRAKAIVTRHQS